MVWFKKVKNVSKRTGVAVLVAEWMYILRCEEVVLSCMDWTVSCQWLGHGNYDRTIEEPFLCVQSSVAGSGLVLVEFQVGKVRYRHSALNWKMQTCVPDRLRSLRDRREASSTALHCIALPFVYALLSLLLRTAGIYYWSPLVYTQPQCRCFQVFPIASLETKRGRKMHASTVSLITMRAVKAHTHTYERASNAMDTILARLPRRCRHGQPK